MGSNLQNLGCRNFQNLGKFFLNMVNTPWNMVNTFQKEFHIHGIQISLMRINPWLLFWLKLM